MDAPALSRRWDDLHAPDAHDQDDGALMILMGDLARALLDKQEGVEATLQAITRSAVDAVPGAVHAGVSLGSKRRDVQNRAATDPVVEELDKLQTDLREGPCLDALWDERTVRVDDMSAETRWPQFAARALELGVGSMIAFQLAVNEHTVGALNLYGDTPQAFGAEAEDIGLIVAAHAAVALVGAQHEADLDVALNSRDVIGQAKGVLMERYKINAEGAFVLLVQTSQRTNVPVFTLSSRLCRTGSPTASPVDGDRAH